MDHSIMGDRVPTIILGGTGYVAGEFIRLVSGHPGLELSQVISNSSAGESVAELFPHLTPVVGAQRFSNFEQALEAIARIPKCVLLAATPHGATAPLLDQALSAAERASTELTVVDASADFRFADGNQFAEVYGQPHGAPHRLKDFFCSVPEHADGTPASHFSQPGCFATAMLLGIVPLLRSGFVEPNFLVSAITGSTGSGRTAKPTTHHPLRHGNLFAYKPLNHRHAPEVVHHASKASGVEPDLQFVPHSGPFARGIHATIFANLSRKVSQNDLHGSFAQAYGSSKLVRFLDRPPQLKNVVGSNFAEIHGTVRNNQAVVFVTIDNLLKGAAGGALQWVNRAFGWPDEEGLTQVAVGMS